MGQFKSSSVPGCRAPHFWLRDGRSLYDALGEGYGLIRFDSERRWRTVWSRRQSDAVCRSLSSTSTMPKRQRSTPRKLVLVRPDRHVAWRADAEPDDPLGLIDHLRGAGVASMRVKPPLPRRRRVGRLARVCHGRYSAAWAGGAESMKPPDCRRHSSA